MSTRKMKRFATIAAIAMIASCVAMPMAAMTASAADVTITMGETKSTFVAYKLLNLTTSGSGSTAKYDYTVNAKYRTALQKVTGKTEDTDIVAFIGGVTDAQAFADAVYAEVNTLEADKTTNEAGQFTVDQGYYLIAETKLGTSDDTYSLIMLDTYGQDSITVNPKEEGPSFEKYIKDENDSYADEENEWQKSADHDMDDAVEFQLVGNLPSDYENYKQYKMVFHDDLDSKNEDKAFKADSLSVTQVYYDANDNGEFDEGDVEIANTVYKLNKAPAAAGHTDFDCDFELEIPNLKNITGESTSGSVVVEYTVVLTTDALMGTPGNWNTAYMEYSNNPYYTNDDGDDSNDSSDGKDNDGDGETDETDGSEGGTPTSESAKDTVVAYTYQTIINKVDQSNKPLTGAEFTLYKWNGSAWNAVTTRTIGDKTVGEGEDAVTTEDCVFTFKGLDDGLYKLEETVKPDGYTKIDDIFFEVEAAHVDEDDALTLTALTVTQTDKDFVDLEEGKITFKPAVNTTAGSITADIVNKSGSLLPSTGGIGTTIFYVVGGTMAAGAGVYLISKKRMKKEEE
ncbi:MAG: LPXTG cell wall anchor domain-containing protein [Oscillospiraceae bacterium]|nr:LPXTG cell wall anchor domain-containing protein [Oscillospiraceae bacterium]